MRMAVSNGKGHQGRYLFPTLAVPYFMAVTYWQSHIGREERGCKNGRRATALVCGEARQRQDRLMRFRENLI
nr:hypothetical protein Q903MT_gene1641 [Picea sitchensis]